MMQNFTKSLKLCKPAKPCSTPLQHVLRLGNSNYHSRLETVYKPLGFAQLSLHITYLLRMYDGHEILHNTRLMKI